MEDIEPVIINLNSDDEDSNEIDSESQDSEPVITSDDEESNESDREMEIL